MISTFESFAAHSGNLVSGHVFLAAESGILKYLLFDFFRWAMTQTKGSRQCCSGTYVHLRMVHFSIFFSSTFTNYHFSNKMIARASDLCKSHTFMDLLSAIFSAPQMNFHFYTIDSFSFLGNIRWIYCSETRASDDIVRIVKYEKVWTPLCEFRLWIFMYESRKLLSAISPHLVGVSKCQRGRDKRAPVKAKEYV